MYIAKRDFKTIEEYNAAIEAHKNRVPKPPGRTRIWPIHPSWEEYDTLFNRNDPTRSQGAFARWAGMAITSVSSAKYKQISKRMVRLIEEWKASFETEQTETE